MALAEPLEGEGVLSSGAPGCPQPLGHPPRPTRVELVEWRRDSNGWIMREMTGQRRRTALPDGPDNLRVVSTLSIVRDLVGGWTSSSAPPHSVGGTSGLRNSCPNHAKALNPVDTFRPSGSVILTCPSLGSLKPLRPPVGR